MAFSIDVPVRFRDTDAMGHVNNAVFLTYLEEARLHFVAGVLPALIEGGLIMARSECDYVRPITVPAGPVTVAMWVESVGRSSFTLGATVEQAGQLAARARTVIVAYDYATARSRALTEAERATLEAAGPENPVRDAADRA